MCDELRQPFAFLPRRSDPRVRVTKPNQSGLKKFVCGRRLSVGALPVKRPAKNELRKTIVFSRHSSEPMVDEGGLSDPSPGNDGNQIDMLVRPGSIQKSNVLVSTKNTASGNRQSGQ